VVTLAIDAFTFHQPVKVGDEVSGYCKTVYRGITSIGVYIERWVFRRDTSVPKQVTEGEFTCVAVDNDSESQTPVKTGISQ